MRGQLARPVLRGAQVSNDLRLLDSSTAAVARFIATSLRIRRPLGRYNYCLCNRNGQCGSWRGRPEIAALQIPVAMTHQVRFAKMGPRHRHGAERASTA